VTKKKVAADPWFQMFAAVAGTAALISAFGTVSTRHAPPKAAAPAAAPAAAAVPAAAPAPAPAGENISPAPKSSSDLATYDPLSAPGGLAAPPVPDPQGAPPAAPKMTLTGAGVGNANGIVAPAHAGGLNGLFAGLMGGLRGPQLVAGPAPMPPANLVVPAHKGVFTVGPAGSMGSDTSSLSDAVYSAEAGDLILVEPGVYDGQVNVLKDVRIRGTGVGPARVTIKWTGPGAAIVVRYTTLDLENVRVERGSFPEFPKAEPGGAVYVMSGSLTMRKVELHSEDSAAPALIAELGQKPTRVTAIDSALSGSKINMIVRGPVKVGFTRVSFDSVLRPIVAWLDAVIELNDCRFKGSNADTAINAYENARVTITGKQKVRIKTERGSDATSIEENFGGARKPALARGGGFTRDIFRRGRKAGELP
jgi:hypothetical protein